MFYAANTMEVGAVRMATRVAVTRGARIHVSARSGIRGDTVRLPATHAPARPNTVLWVLLDGAATIEHAGVRTDVTAPCAITVPESWIEGAEGKRSARIQSWGATYASIQVCFRAPCTDLTVLSLDAALVPELESMHERILASENDLSMDLLRGLLWKFVAVGLVPSEAGLDRDLRLYEDRTTQRVWEAMQQRFAALDVNPSLKAIAADVNLSVRHAHRIMTNLFELCLLPPGGFREATVNLRLSLASLVLSEPSLSVGVVAKIAGYTHPETLAAAFRRAGLPSPLAVRQGYKSEPVPPSQERFSSGLVPTDDSTDVYPGVLEPEESAPRISGRVCLRPMDLRQSS